MPKNLPDVITPPDLCSNILAFGKSSKPIDQMIQFPVFFVGDKLQDWNAVVQLKCKTMHQIVNYYHVF